MGVGYAGAAGSAGAARAAGSLRFSSPSEDAGVDDDVDEAVFVADVPDCRQHAAEQNALPFRPRLLICPRGERWGRRGVGRVKWRGKYKVG